MSETGILKFILPTHHYSDGTCEVCTRPNATRNDVYLQERLLAQMIREPFYLAMVPAGYTPDYPHMPGGYSCWQRPRDNNSSHIDYFVYGHPNGYFDSFPKFWVHFDHMQRSGTTAGCQCVRCVPRKRKQSGRASSGRRIAATMAQTPSQTQEGGDDDARELWSEDCLTVHSAAAGCDDGTNMVSAEEAAELWQSLGIGEDVGGDEQERGQQ